MRITAGDGRTVTLNKDHWETHVLTRHPELNDQWDRVVETLEIPERVCRSKRDEASRIYCRSYANLLIGGRTFEQLSLLVIVRDDTGFVVTAYFAAAGWRSLGEQLWPS